MPVWTLDLNTNIPKEALGAANSIDVLTAAMKSEEKALGSSKLGLAKAFASGDAKQIEKTSAKVKESADKIGNLKKAVANARADGQRPAKLGLIDAVEKSGGPIGGLIRNAKAAGKAFDEMGAGGKVAVLLTGLGVAATYAGFKLLGLAKDAATLGIGFADSARSARILNDAADIAGGTHKQLTGIIEDVRRRSDLSRGTIAGYARELRILGFDSRSTQVILGAMAVAETALGSGASGAVRGIAEQSRAMRRFTLGVRDAYGEYTALRQAGLKKADIFEELAKGSGKSVGAVKDALGKGQISVKAGMAAIDAALRKKYGGTVGAQAMSVTSQVRRMSEDFEGLFTTANMEPFLKGLQSITSIFSSDTASGRSFQKIVSGLFTDLGKTAEELGPQIKEALLSLSAEAAKPGGLATAIRGWINDAKELGGTIKDVANDIKSIASSAATIGGAVSSVTGAFTHKADDTELRKLNARGDTAQQLREQGKTDGQALVAGVAQGIELGTGAALGTISGLAASLKSQLRGDLKMQSPSKVFADEGAHIPAGVAKGVARATPIARASIAQMSGAMVGGFRADAGTSGGTSAPITNNFYATFQGMDRDAELEQKVKRWAFDAFVGAVKNVADRGVQPQAA